MADAAVDAMAEIDAMKAVVNAVDALESETRGRVIRWAAERYSVSITLSAKPKHLATLSPSATASSGGDCDQASGEFESAAELLAAVNAETEADKALVVGYWLQVVLGQPEIEAQAVNTELKHQGHGLGNVTRAFDSLIQQRPQLVIQLRKSGSARQARKKYKLTTTGIQRVRRMLQNGPGNGGNE